MNAYRINNYVMYWWQEFRLWWLYMNGHQHGIGKIATSKHINEFSHCLIIRPIKMLYHRGFRELVNIYACRANSFPYTVCTWPTIQKFIIKCISLNSIWHALRYVVSYQVSCCCCCSIGYWGEGDDREI